MGTRVTALTVRNTERRRAARQLQPGWGIRDGRWAGRAGGRRWRALRRVVAVALVFAAGLVAAVGTGQDGDPLVVAVTADLALGTVLSTGDLVMVRTSSPPDGVVADVDDALGRRLAGAVRRGELLTDRRLIGDNGPDPGPDRIAVAVRPNDPALLSLLQPGMAVAVVGVSQDGTPVPLADEAIVLALLPESGNRSPPVLLSVPAADADRVTAATMIGDVALRFTPP